MTMEKLSAFEPQCDTNIALQVALCSLQRALILLFDDEATLLGGD